ncbi:hypothetical protein AU377_14785 [Sporosarcina sp. HYO08]|nr:hypothetical protein AU377_14785 [Sporosarcina sp. HYO08]
MDEEHFRLKWLKIKLRNGSLFSCEIQQATVIKLNAKETTAFSFSLTLNPLLFYVTPQYKRPI